MKELLELKDRIQKWHEQAVKGQAKAKISVEYRNYLQGRSSMAATILDEIEHILQGGNQ